MRYDQRILAGPEELLERISGVRLAVIGDFCLDAYWYADMTLSALSREVPNFPLPITGEKVSPGAAGNVACNIMALKPGSLRVLSVIGDDWRGELLRKALRDAGVDTAGLLTDARRVTNAYIKPMKKGYSGVVYESERLDFENRSPLDPEAERALEEALEKAAADTDVLCVGDQMTNGCVTERIREKICEMGRDGLRVIVDSRDRIGLYHDVIVKPNDMEAARALGGEVSPRLAARRLSEKNGRCAIVTTGEKGCVVSAEGKTEEVPPVRAEGPLDICGAGDTFLSAFACGLGSGLDPFEAAYLGNIASSVTIRKLGMTGTATREEIREAVQRIREAGQ